MIIVSEIVAFGAAHDIGVSIGTFGTGAVVALDGQYGTANVGISRMPVAHSIQVLLKIINCIKLMGTRYPYPPYVSPQSLVPVKDLVIPQPARAGPAASRPAMESKSKSLILIVIDGQTTGVEVANEA